MQRYLNLSKDETVVGTNDGPGSLPSEPGPEFRDALERRRGFHTMPPIDADDRFRAHDIRLPLAIETAVGWITSVGVLEWICFLSLVGVVFFAWIGTP